MFPAICFLWGSQHRLRSPKEKQNGKVIKEILGDTGDAGQQISVTADVGAGAGAGFIEIKRQ